MKRLSVSGVRRAVIVAPHADDEVIGAYGLIRQLRQTGARVTVIVATDGAASHPHSLAWPRRRLVAERRRETRRAMRRIGVAAGAIDFLDLADGRLSPTGGQTRRRLARAIARHCANALIVLPSEHDAHPDHRAVAMVAARVVTPGTRRLDYLVWADRTRTAAPPTLRLPLAQQRPAKRAAIKRYRTQMGVIRDDPHGFAIARHELAAFTRPCEHFREHRR